MNKLERDNRREYWATTMDDAFAFMQKAKDMPVVECHEKLASLADAARQTGVDISFSKKLHVDDLPRLFYLREGLINDFLEIASKINSRGWVLHIEDAYRTSHMQRKLAGQIDVFEMVVRCCKWETGKTSLDYKFLFRRLAALIAFWPKVATHMSGSALDISVFSRTDRHEIERGGPYLMMSEITPMQSPFISKQSRLNRMEITEIFETRGFVAYPFEFWHYSKGDVFEALVKGDESPSIYGPVDWNSETRNITPVDNPLNLLNSEDDIKQMTIKTGSKALK